MSVTEDEVKKLAFLARIDMSAQGITTRTRDINGILQWIEQLEAVPTEGVEPLRDIVGTTLTLREDKVTDGGYPDKVLANAPESTQGFYVVPKVVE